MSMNKFDDLNDWQDNTYYERKHKQRTAEAAYLFRLIWGTAIAVMLIWLLMSCNRTTYQQAPQPERIACDTLIDRMTGERIPVYNCETTW